MLFRRMLIALSLFHFNLNAAPNPALTSIDINNAFPPLTETRSMFGGFYEGVRPTNSSEISFFNELSDFYLFYALGDDVGYEPHIFDKKTNTVSLFKALDNDPNLEDSVSRRGSISPLYGNHFLLSDRRSETGWFLSDGTPAGTVPFHSPIPTFKHIEALNQDLWLIFDTIDFYRFNPNTEELVKLADFGRAETVTKVGRYAVIEEEYPGQENTFIVTDGSEAGTSTIHYDKLVTNVLNNNRTIGKPNDFIFAYEHENNEQKVISYIDPDLGPQKLVSLNALGKCNGEVITGLDTDQIALRKEGYWAFGVETESKYSCIVSFNESTSEFYTISRQDLNAKRWILLGLEGHKAYIQADFSFTPNRKLMRILELDTSASTVQFLIEPTEANTDIEIFAQSEEFIFGYYSVSCDARCLDNMFFRLELSTGEMTNFGSRLGHTDSRSDVHDWGRMQSSFIHEGELIFTASMPYPGIFKTDSSIKNIRAIGFTSIDKDTSLINNVTSSIYQFSFGWLSFREFANQRAPLLVELDENGNKTLTTLTDPRMDYFSGNDLKTSEWNGKAYFYNQSVYEYDPISKSFSIILDGSADSSSEKQLTWPKVIDNIVYGSNNNSELESYNLSTGEFKLVGPNVPSNVFKCGDNTFGTVPNSSNGGALYQLTPSSQALITENQSERFIALTDAVEAGHIVIISGNNYQVMNCVTSAITEKLPLNDLAIEANSINWGYNRFDNAIYFYAPDFSDDVENYELRVLNLYDYSLHRIGGFTNDVKLAFSANGIYGTEKWTGNILKLTDGSFQPVSTQPHHSDYEYKFELLANDDELDRFIFGAYITEDSARNSISGREPFVFDSQTEEFHLLDLFSGPQSSFFTNDVLLQNGLAVINASTQNIENEVAIIDLACVAKGSCKNLRVNRPPSIDDALHLFYELGNQVYIPFRANDPDGDELQYSIENGPEWLTVDEEGVVKGVVPESFASEYSFSVGVTDGYTQVLSEPYILEIDNPLEEEEPTPPAPPEPSPTPEIPPASNASESGGGSFSWILLLWMLLICTHRVMRRESH